MAQDKVMVDMQLEIKVGNFQWSGKLSDVTRIDMNNINVEMARQADLVSWFGVVMVDALDEMTKLKNKLEALSESQDSLYAELDVEVRKTVVGDKKPTEADIKSRILTHSRYTEHVAKIQATREDLRVAMIQRERIVKILIGLEHKKDMLVQLSANIRRELVTGDYQDGPGGSKE